MLLDIGIKAEGISRLFLRQVSWELRTRKVKGLNAIQAMILLKIGKQEMSVGDLASRGMYLGTNPAYNLSALIDNGYLDSFTTLSDGRVRILKATPKGMALYAQLYPLFNINTDVTRDCYQWLCVVENFINQWKGLDHA